MKITFDLAAAFLVGATAGFTGFGAWWWIDTRRR